MEWKIVCIDEDTAQHLDTLFQTLVQVLGEEGAPLSVERLEEPDYEIKTDLGVEEQDIDLNAALDRFKLGVDP